MKPPLMDRDTYEHQSRRGTWMDFGLICFWLLLSVINLTEGDWFEALLFAVIAMYIWMAIAEFGRGYRRGRVDGIELADRDWIRLISQGGLHQHGNN